MEHSLVDVPASLGRGHGFDLAVARKELSDLLVGNVRRKAEDLDVSVGLEVLLRALLLLGAFHEAHHTGGELLANLDLNAVVDIIELLCLVLELLGDLVSGFHIDAVKNSHATIGVQLTWAHIDNEVRTRLEDLVLPHVHPPAYVVFDVFWSPVAWKKANLNVYTFLETLLNSFVQNDVDLVLTDELVVSLSDGALGVAFLLEQNVAHHAVLTKAVSFWTRYAGGDNSAILRKQVLEIARTDFGREIADDDAAFWILEVLFEVLDKWGSTDRGEVIIRAGHFINSVNSGVSKVFGVKGEDCEAAGG